MDGKSELVKAALEVVPVKEAYTDLAKPAFREAGQAIGQATALLNSALRPLKTLQLTWNLLFDRLDGWIQDELAGAPLEELQEPPAIVVGTVLPGLFYAQDEPELKSLFVRLLATSMERSRCRKAHPAFAELIKQMTPLEARMLERMQRRDVVPLIRIRSCIPRENRSYDHWIDPKPGMTLDELENMTNVHWGEPWEEDAVWSLYDIGEFADHAPLIASLENLQRLSLIEIDKDTAVAEGDAAQTYVDLASSAAVLDYISKVRRRGKVPWITRGVISLTAYGELFIDACIAKPERPAAASSEA